MHLVCGCSTAWNLLKGAGQVMSDFNSDSHGLASPASWRPIKPDSSPLSLAEGTEKAGKEQLLGMLKSSMMGSVNSANGSLSPCCLAHFIRWGSQWQKVYWTLTVSTYKLFPSAEKHLCYKRAWLSAKWKSGVILTNRFKIGNTCQNLPGVFLFSS